MHARRASIASPTTTPPSSSRNAGSITRSSRPQDHDEVFDTPGVPTTTRVSPASSPARGPGPGSGSHRAPQRRSTHPCGCVLPCRRSCGRRRATVGDRQPVDREPLDALAEPTEVLDHAGGAEQLGERARFLLVERDRLADGVGVVRIVDQQVDATRLMLQHAQPGAALVTNSNRTPSPGSGVSLTVDMRPSSQPGCIAARTAAVDPFGLTGTSPR